MLHWFKLFKLNNEDIRLLIISRNYQKGSPSISGYKLLGPQQENKIDLQKEIRDLKKFLLPSIVNWHTHEKN